jgi:membrane protein DedA with SNARE-associated domain
MPSLLAQYGLVVVALIIFCGEIGLPTLIPGELALVFAGSQFIHSPATLVAAIVGFGILDVIATSTIHVGSRSAGNRLLMRVLRLIMQDPDRAEQTLVRWRERLGGYDSLVVFVTRLIPMFRLYASISTGLIRIRLRSFFAGVIPASFVWATTPLTVGFLLRNRVGSITHGYSAIMHSVILGSIALTLLIFVSWWMLLGSSSSFTPRRFRVIVGVAAFLAAFGRLIELAVSDFGHTYQFVIPSVPAVPIRVGVITLAAAGLLWVAARDLRMLRTHHEPRGIRGFSAIGWAGLTLAMVLFSAWNGAHAPLV